jgi:dTDP-4-amino-4,6-dideoxygalactose transaminase
VQLRRAEELWQSRARVATRYDAGFADVPQILTPARRDDVRHAWHLYPIRLQTDQLRIGRDEFIEAMRARGIGTSVHFIPLHLHHYYRTTFGYRPDQCPNAERASAQLISLPIYPRLSAESVDRVIGVVTDLVRSHRR